MKNLTFLYSHETNVCEAEEISHKDNQHDEEVKRDVILS
jgi:hypothetical protein